MAPLFRPVKILLLVLSLILLLNLYQTKHLTSTSFRDLSSFKHPKVAKVTVATNALNSAITTRALRTHMVHNHLHGYTHYVAMREIVNEQDKAPVYPAGAWSKPAYLLSLLVSELLKPEDERLQWLFWFDADTVILNTHIPLETFLPPDKPELEDIHILFGANWDGINSGVFPIRVHPWSVDLISAVLSYPTYFPTNATENPFRDQSAFQWLLQSSDSPFVIAQKYEYEHWQQVPMRWFNSLPINNAFTGSGDWIFGSEMTPDKFDNGTMDVYDDGIQEWEFVDLQVRKKVHEWKIMRGDMVVHFAGSSNVRDSWMGPWLDRAEALLPEWNDANALESLQNETREFWQEQAGRTGGEKMISEILRNFRKQELETNTTMDDKEILTPK